MENPNIKWMRGSPHFGHLHIPSWPYDGLVWTIYRKPTHLMVPIHHDSSNYSSMIHPYLITSVLLRVFLDLQLLPHGSHQSLQVESYNADTHSYRLDVQPYAPADRRRVDAVLLHLLSKGNNRSYFRKSTCPEKIEKAHDGMSRTIKVRLFPFGPFDFDHHSHAHILVLTSGIKRHETTHAVLLGVLAGVASQAILSLNLNMLAGYALAVQQRGDRPFGPSISSAAFFEDLCFATLRRNIA